ncbi:hypothetical protein [Fluviicola chungangensis]|uniref:hypothetical protein n=1 Tax=Fluviicola chungangensis TaxID=2597671 RepID=UPI001642C1E4|nr:hypothetical protein [Fluviicola chungangensis]
MPEALTMSPQSQSKAHVTPANTTEALTKTHTSAAKRSETLATTAETKSNAG